jgi:hypothetical protein
LRLELSDGSEAVFGAAKARNFSTQFPRTITAVNAELTSRRAAGEAAQNAQIADFAAVALQCPDESWFLRVAFVLTDGTTFVRDTIEPIAIDDVHNLRRARLN